MYVHWELHGFRTVKKIRPVNRNLFSSKQQRVKKPTNVSKEMNDGTVVL